MSVAPSPPGATDASLFPPGDRYTCTAVSWGNPARAALRKTPRPGRALSAGLRNEARILALLDGVPGVPQLLDADPGGDWLVQTLLPGRVLREVAPRLRGDVPAVLAWLLSLLDILQAVHGRGVLHGHVAPAKLLWTEDGGAGLLDFSRAVAQQHVPARLVPDARHQGLLFLAPEQTGRMARELDYRADYYALGAVGYWLLTGQPPLDEAEPLAWLHALLTRPPRPAHVLQPALAPSLSAVLDRLLAKDPAQRYQSAHGLRQDLLRCQRGEDFRPGADDHRTQPTRPSRLVGRAAALAQLQQALDGGGARSRVVLLRGYAGAGKSALVQAMAPLLAQRQGWIATGKYTQVRRLQAFSGLADALAEIAAHWCAAPPAQQQAVRAGLLRRLGRDAALLAQTVPAFAALLWPGQPPAAEARAGAGDGALLQRMGHAVAAVCSVLREAAAPCLLFLDDLQWVDADSLALMESLVLEHSRGALLLVGAYRDHAVDAAHPLASRLAHWREAGAALLEIEVGGLGREDVAALLADVLDDTPQALAPLAAALHARSGGNAFFVLDHVRRLFDARQLRREDGRWRWSDAALAALPGSDKLVAGLIEEMQRLPAAVQDLAGGCACQGGAIDVEALATVRGSSPAEVEQLLLPLLRRGILHSVQGALRFGHDRMQEAALALLDAAAHRRWHLGLSRALAQRAAQDSDSLLRAAGHALEVADELHQPQDCRAALALLLPAARQALAGAAAAPALRFLRAADMLDRRLPADAGRRHAIALLLHAALFAHSLFEEMDALFAAELQPATAAAAVPVHEAVARQVLALMLRGRNAESMELALRVAGLLGLQAPDEAGWLAALDAELDQLQRRLAQADEQQFLRLAPLRDPQLLAASVLYGVAQTNPVDRHQSSAWCSLRLIRLALDHGSFDALPQALTGAFTPLATRRRDYALGCRLGRMGVALLGQLGGAQDAARTLWRWANVVSTFCEPLETRFDHYPRIEALAHRCGDTQVLAENLVWELLACFDLGPQLERMDPVLERAFALSQRSRNQMTLGSFHVYRWLREHAGASAAPQPGEAADAAEQALDALIGDSAHARIHGAVMRIVAAAIDGDWPRVLRRCEQAQAVPMLANTYHYALRRWLRALALCQARLHGRAGADAAARAAADARWLARRAAEAPANFGHMATLVLAMQAWADGDAAQALPLFERAIDGAAARPWQHGLACELAAACGRALGLARAADAWLAEAVQAWSQWGAPGQAARLRALASRPQALALLPWLRPEGPGEDAGAAPRIDTQAITSAGLALVAEREPARLLDMLLTLVQHYAAAEHGLLCWRAEDGWPVIARFDPQGRAIGAGPAAPPGALSMPAPVRQALLDEGAPLLLHALARHPSFARDAGLAQRGVQSLVGLPIVLRGQTTGLLYLENRQAPTTLDDGQLETLRLICVQFAAAYENARLYSRLESMVPSAPRPCSAARPPCTPSCTTRPCRSLSRTAKAAA